MSSSTKTSHPTLPSSNGSPAALTIERGTIRDYDALARFHYRAGRPATVAKIICAVDRAPTVIDRAQLRPVGRTVAGVLVLSWPVLGSTMRNHALGNRYDHLTPTERATAINHEVRTISRVIIDPRYRGRGLAVELVTHALAHAATPVTEAVAAMGRVHPFFEKAGMIRLDPPASPASERLRAALDACSLTPASLLSHDVFENTLNTLTEAERAFITREVAAAARPRAHTSPAPLSLARRALFDQPAYYIHVATNTN